MNRWIFLLAIIILCILQLTFLDSFRIFNIKPDFLLVSIVLASLIFDLKWALFLGVFAGLLKDVFSTLPLGTNTLMCALWSFLIVKLSKKMSIDNNFIRMALIIIVAFLNHLITGLIFIYLGNPVPFGIFFRIVFIGSIYTAIVFLLVIKVKHIESVLSRVL